MATKTTLDTLYLINSSNRKVSLEIKVGDKGQNSLLNVKVNNATIIEGKNGNLEKTDIGSNNELNGKTLKILATIADTSRETNLTFLEIKLSGGFLTKSYSLYKLVDNEGDSADYLCRIEFHNPTS